MPVRQFPIHTTTTTAPIAPQPGDEWFHPTTGALQKAVMFNGAVNWRSIASAFGTGTTTAQFPLVSAVSGTANSVIAAAEVSYGTRGNTNEDLILGAPQGTGSVRLVGGGTVAGGGKETALNAGQYNIILKFGGTSATYGVLYSSRSVFIGGDSNTIGSFSSGQSDRNVMISPGGGSVIGTSGASSQSTIVGGGSSTIRSGNYNTIIGTNGGGVGTGNNTPSNCFVAGGNSNEAYHHSGVALGTLARSDCSTLFALGGNNAGYASAYNQTVIVVYNTNTTDATPRVMTSEPNASSRVVNVGSTTNNWYSVNYSQHVFTLAVHANLASAAATAYGATWIFRVIVDRKGSAATTTFWGGTPTLLYSYSEDVSLNTVSVALTVDTTLATGSGMIVTVTGLAATTIYWTAQIIGWEVRTI